MPTRKKGYRTCARCHNGRVLSRYVGARGRICDTCRAGTRRAGSKDQRLKATFNITHEQWLRLLAYNDGKCWICNGKRKGKGGTPLYDTDHDHAMEKAGVPIEETIRGLLCKRCNRRLLPSALDRVDILERAIWYLLHAHAIAQEILGNVPTQEDGEHG